MGGGTRWGAWDPLPRGLRGRDTRTMRATAADMETGPPAEAPRWEVARTVRATAAWGGRGGRNRGGNT